MWQIESGDLKVAKQTKMSRRERFMPGGIPKHIRVWDNPEAGDRYTVCFTGRYRQNTGGEFVYIGMNERPYHPAHGLCQRGSNRTQIDCPDGWSDPVGSICRHDPELGHRIHFQDLPKDCQKIVLGDYEDLWDCGKVEKKSAK